MSLTRVTITGMDTYVFLIIGLVIGAIVGWLLGSRGKGAGGDVAVATRAEMLQQQVDQLEAQRIARDERDREENKLVNELAPVKENLKQMREAVAAMERERVEQVTSLKAAIQQSLESDRILQKQTESLAAALSSNSVRGVWGEAQLRRLVELAGLLKHADFDEQATITTGRADMIINLPGGKQLAIDSKVPYNSYQEASKISELAGEAELARRSELIKAHSKAVKGHIDTLATKQYWTSLNASPDFVIAFIPSEGLLSAAIENDPGLLDYAFSKNVALASPVSLFSVLKTINYIWRQNVDDSQVRNLIKLGHELYERVGKVAELADKLGRSITTTVKDFNAFISSFETRMLVTARKLNDLDENELAIDTIATPAQIESAPKAITAAEADAKETDK